MTAAVAPAPVAPALIRPSAATGPSRPDRHGGPGHHRGIRRRPRRACPRRACRHRARASRRVRRSWPSACASLSTLPRSVRWRRPVLQTVRRLAGRSGRASASGGPSSRSAGPSPIDPCDLPEGRPRGSTRPRGARRQRGPRLFPERGHRHRTHGRRRTAWRRQVRLAASRADRLPHGIVLPPRPRKHERRLLSHPLSSQHRIGHARDKKSRAIPSSLSRIKTCSWWDNRC